MLVCLYHFVYSPSGFIEIEWLRESFNWGQKGVEIFFIISAIVIPISLMKGDYSIKRAPNFLLRRVVRVEPPYLIAVLLGITYLVARNYVPSSAAVDLVPTATEVILHVGYLIPFVEGTNWINPVVLDLGHRVSILPIHCTHVSAGSAQKAALSTCFSHLTYCTCLPWHKL